MNTHFQFKHNGEFNKGFLADFSLTFYGEVNFLLSLDGSRILWSIGIKWGIGFKWDRLLFCENSFAVLGLENG